MRVVAKTWSEYIGTSLVKYTLTVCPDPKCQKAVEEEIKKKRDHLANLQAKSLKRQQNNMRNKRKTVKKSSRK